MCGELAWLYKLSKLLKSLCIRTAAVLMLCVISGGSTTECGFLSVFSLLIGAVKSGTASVVLSIAL